MPSTQLHLFDQHPWTRLAPLQGFPRPEAVLPAPQAALNIESNTALIPKIATGTRCCDLLTYRHMVNCVVGEHLHTYLHEGPNEHSLTPDATSPWVDCM